MDALPALLLVFVLTAVAGARYRPPPFLLLSGAAALFVLLSGTPPALAMTAAIGGLGRVFSLLGVIVLGGAVLSKVMLQEGYLDIILGDLERFIRRPVVFSGIAGYILAIPMMCCITAFIVLEPIVSSLRSADRTGRVGALALGSMISFTFIYPSPVTLAIFETLPESMRDPAGFNLVSIPLSLLLLAGAVLLQQGGIAEKGSIAGMPPVAMRARLRAWSPLLTIGAALIPGYFVFRLPASSLIQFAMFAGMLGALSAASPGRRVELFERGAKHGGLIIFDLCAAGALAGVIGAGPGFSMALEAFTTVMPAAIAPFAVAALVQGAQGSRVATALVCAELFRASGYPASIGAIPFVLMICAGACAVSFVTDPFFWLVHRSTGERIGDTVRYYSAPAAILGLGALAFALALVYMGTG